jgi:hypothetical protein
MPVTALKFVNLVTFVVVVALNGLAATGAMSGDSIGVLANRYQSLFLPANWVFGIWSLIYLGLGASVVYQLLPLPGARRVVERLGWWWAVTGVLNVAWISLFSFSQFGLALVVMLLLLVALIIMAERLRDGELDPEEATRPGVRLPAATRTDWADRCCVRWPLDLYLAWISVAVISNIFQYAHVVGFGGFGISELMWSVTMMFVATLLGAFMSWSRGMWVFPFVVAWALYGIGQRYADNSILAVTANSLVVGGLALGVASWIMGSSLRRYGAVV